MVELWQAIILLGAGTVLGLGAGYVQRLWAKSDTLEADRRASERRLQEEDREATRRKEAEERAVRREWRRDQIKPVVEFLEATKRYFAGQEMQHTAEAAWEQNAGGIKDKVSLQDLRKYLAKDDHFAGTDFYDLVKAYLVAISTTPEMTQQLLGLFIGVTSAREPAEVGKQSAAIGALERQLEDYVTKV